MNRCQETDRGSAKGVMFITREDESANAKPHRLAWADFQKATPCEINLSFWRVSCGLPPLNMAFQMITRAIVARRDF